MRIFVTRRLPGAALDRLPAAWDVHVWPERRPPDRDRLLRHTRAADGLLCLLTDRIDAEFMDACSRLRVVSNMAVGVDNIDVAAAEQRGTRLGIIGMGRIGQAVAARAESFGMDVVHSGRSSGLELAELLRTSDIVSLHCPLTTSTTRLIDDTALATMKRGAILVNTARGAMVDQQALARALHSGHLGAAALDVTDPEPLSPVHPLLDAPNLIVLPHLGSATHRTRERMADLAVANLTAGVAGEPLPNSVGPPIPSRAPLNDQGAPCQT
jgi:glyoxylate reductase